MVMNALEVATCATTKERYNVHSNALLFDFSLQPGSHLIICDHPQDTQSLVKQAQAIDPCSDRIFHFPDWQVLPYDQTLPAKTVIGERLSTLHQLCHTRNPIIILPLTALMQKTPPPVFIANNYFHLQIDQSYALSTIKTQLRSSNYTECTLVTEPGTFAIRGSLIDVFLNGQSHPIRIDFFDDTIEKISLFSPKTQLTVSHINEINCLPGSEYDLTQVAITTFRNHWRSVIGNTNHSVYRQVSQGQQDEAWIQYMPFFHNESATLFDYICPESKVHFIGKSIKESANSYFNLIKERYQEAIYRTDYPAIPIEQLYLNPDGIIQRLQAFSPTQYSDFERTKQPELERLQPDTSKTIIAIASPGRRQQVQQQLKANHHTYTTCQTWAESIESKHTIVVTPLDINLGFHHPKLRLIVENDCFQQSKPQQHNTIKPSQTQPYSTLTEGDLVVHAEQGIGIYQGLQTVQVNSIDQEFIVIHYKDQDKLYLPVNQLNLVQPYLGLNPDEVQLDVLGSGKWLKKRQKAEKRIEDIAAKLLAVYAERAQKVGISHPTNNDHIQEFNNACDFDLTHDQAQASQTILEDLKASKPMDRLLCADVGFGKTEVAMRACFAVADAGHQIIVLVPTTLLAEQHYRTFCERFHQCPIEISLLTRHNLPKQRREKLQAWDKGKITILITTHIILNQSINTDQLGLLIIDEEHRFGVKQKERLKSLKANVDILSLTATPIPRTLHLSLSGLKDISLIQTPPKTRIPTLSFVSRANPSLIQEALSRELLRGGQAFYLHNRVSTLEAKVQFLQSLLPKARIAMMHGQMSEHHAERIMLAFIQHQYDILVCTTIIESGIDIPNANTILIERADKLGLAQLHQIRGRVGRSNRQAYAYFLTQEEGDPPKEAQRRLLAIEKASKLGAGYQIASEDLDIRGTGEILGDEQSGHAGLIGLNLYHELLQEAIATKENPTRSTTKRYTTQMELPLSTAIPIDYMPSPMLRLEFYRKIQNTDDSKKLLDLRENMRDRFGRLPESCALLFKVRSYQLNAEKLGIKKIHASRTYITFHLNPQSDLNTEGLIQLIQRHSHHYQLIKQTQLRCQLQGVNLNHSVCECLDHVLKVLTPES